MKIRPNDHTFEIDQITFEQWKRLGRITENASVFQNGKWIDLNQNTTKTKFAAVTTFLALFNVFTFVITNGWSSEVIDFKRMIRLGAYAFPLIIDHGELWRLITSVFLHIGFSHFFFNVILLIIFGNLIERIYGGLTNLFIFVSSATIGNVLSLLWIRDSIGVGASGGIFGLVGVMIAYGIRFDDLLDRKQRRFFGIRLLPFVILDFLIGYFVPDVNLIAHFGGLITGFLIGIFAHPKIHAENDKILWSETAGIFALIFMSVSFGLAGFHALTDPPDLLKKKINAVLTTESIISQYERRARKKYELREFQTLEKLYFSQFFDSDRDEKWIEKLQKLYEKALIADPESDFWNTELIQLYIDLHRNQSDEVDQLQKYIRVCERVAKKKGFHRELYRNFEFFVQRLFEIDPDQRTKLSSTIEKLYRSAISADEKNSSWYNNLAWFHVETENDLEEAIRLSRIAVQIDPNSEIFLDTLAWSYAKNDQPIRALNVFESILWNGEDPKTLENSWKGLDLLIDQIDDEDSEFRYKFVKMADRLIKHFPNDTEMRRNLWNATLKIRDRFRQ